MFKQGYENKLAYFWCDKVTFIIIVFPELQSAVFMPLMYFYIYQ